MFSSTLHTLRLRMHSSMFDALFAPRKPRHPLLRIGIGLVGLALLAVLLVFGVVIGAGMLAVGLVSRALRQRARPVAPADVLDAEFRIVDKPLLR
ncbi:MULTISPECIES: hypothetical protein [unclassified Luteimonas]|uniref:hypothetical protein n=1 Tax=Lysobacteraceae TaxID=32033 RepID=UPI001E3EC816|nr:MULTISPECIES: hypothetical protein [unclassified Luteimonas]MCD9047708.1 hypothetical protein [Luteimonas sp. MHLX1A]